MKVGFLFTFTILAVFSFAQNIGDVKRNDSGYTIVYDAANHQISSGYVGDQTYDWDFSSCLIVIRVKDGKYTMVFDEQLHQVASGYTGEDGFSFKVVGKKIVLKRKDGWKMIYDKELHLLEAGW